MRYPHRWVRTLADSLISRCYLQYASFSISLIAHTYREQLKLFIPTTRNLLEGLGRCPRTATHLGRMIFCYILFRHIILFLAGPSAPQLLSFGPDSCLSSLSNNTARSLIALCPSARRYCPCLVYLPQRVFARSLRHVTEPPSRAAPTPLAGTPSKYPQTSKAAVVFVLEHSTSLWHHNLLPRALFAEPLPPQHRRLLKAPVIWLVALRIQ